MSQLKSRRKARAKDESPLYIEKLSMIREAAGRVFYRKGYTATKLADVAEEAGMDRVNLYYYVGSKKDLYREVVSEAAEQIVVDAEQLEQQPLSTRDKLQCLIKMLMQSFERGFPYVYVFVQDDLLKLQRQNNPEDDEWLCLSLEWSRRYFHVVKNILTQGIDQGEVRTTLPPGVLASCLIGMLNSSSHWFQPSDVLPAEDIAAGMANMVLSGLMVKP